VSVHSGTIGGDVGGRYVRFPVVVVHCDECEEVHAEANLIDKDAVYEFAIAAGWKCDEGEPELCPECAAKAPHAEASR
jgi:hypothetical protein